jgi:predicted TIM-barrel fold metal-dependent hydrolase
MVKFCRFKALLVLLVIAPVTAADPDRLPLVDAHIHYSQDAWQMIPAEKAVAILRRAGVSRAFVSSSNDDGTLKLLAEAPDLIVPVLRPYRRRGELTTWMNDETVVDMLRERLKNKVYAGIGEFHAFGDDIDLPVVREVIALARQHRLFLHAHSDTDAVHRIFRQYPGAVVLWAHGGFEGPEQISEMLAQYPNLWADLAFRSEHAIDGEVDSAWREMFERFPDRFLLGTDTFTPERWFYVEDHASWSRQWLADLPIALRDAIAHDNAENLLRKVGR